MAEHWRHPVNIVARIAEAGHTFRYALGGWYRWTGTHYALVEYMEGQIDRLVEDQYEKAWHAKIMLAGDGPKPDRPVVQKTTIEAVLRKMRTELSRDGTQPAYLINFQNGTLDLNTGDLLPHDPVHFLVGEPTVAFDPEAKAPAWGAFLDEVLPEQPAQQLLQRWFGYCLTSDTSLQRCLMLCGASRGGKGLIGRILADVVGNDKTCGLKLQLLGNDHGLQGLLGKSLGLVDEVTLDFRSDKGTIVSNLLSIVGETPLAVNPKNRDILPYVRIGARLCFIANQLVNFSDGTGAMANRMLFLHFTKSFAGREDVGLYQRLKAELPGVIAWALRGLYDLREAGFPVVASSQALAEESRELNNHVLRFASERLEVGPAFTTPKDGMYQAYRAWCYDNGIAHPYAENQFAKLLIATNPDRVAAARVQQGGRRAQQWTGVKLLPE